MRGRDPVESQGSVPARQPSSNRQLAGIICRAKSPNGQFANWFIFSMFSALGRENAKLFPLLSISSQLWEMYALASSTHGILLDIILAYFGGNVKRKMPGRGACPVDAESTMQRPETTAAETKMHHDLGRGSFLNCGVGPDLSPAWGL